MTLRLVFDRDDLQRVQLADGPDPLWELVLGLLCARDRDPQLPAHLARWRRQAGVQVRRDAHAKEWLSTLFTLVPAAGNFPDFLTPAYDGGGIDAGCAAVAGTRRGLLETDLPGVFRQDEPPSWVRELATGDRRQLSAVTGAVRSGYEAMLAPQWHEISGATATDRASRARVLARAGVGGLLAGIPGVISWDGQVLEIGYGRRTHTVHLHGRGLTLLPSFFCTERPITLVDPELPPVLVYPAAGTPLTGVLEVSPRLVALLGRTRAECLSALTSTRTTSELAAAVGTSIASASKHATVLREAGLVTSVRHRAAVRHHVTQLGSALLKEC
jgi:DNA-binding transcriptional ArsR family regulator